MLMAGFEMIKHKNESLLIFGGACLLGALICLILVKYSSTEVSGINAWIKPLKFFLSIAIFAFTMAWYLPYLDNQKQVSWYCWSFIVFLTVEVLLISFQAARGRKSHYNMETPSDRAIFALMGLAILVVLIHTLVITTLFFMQKQFQASEEIVLSIKISMVLLLVFALEGFLMSVMLKHTVGADDGSRGIAVLNWSKSYGDLRVAHFFGIHALQVIPILTFLLANSKKEVYLISILYFLFVTFTLVQALLGKSFIK